MDTKVWKLGSFREISCSTVKSWYFGVLATEAKKK